MADREEMLAREDMKLAKQRLRVALLRQSDGQRGCSEPECPGPRFLERGGCPMGYSGSCRKSRYSATPQGSEVNE